MSQGEHGARLFGSGYRRYDGPRRAPAWALVTLAVFTGRRVLGLGRGARHKVLPAITLGIAFAPALVSVALAALADPVPVDELRSGLEQLVEERPFMLAVRYAAAPRRIHCAAHRR